MTATTERACGATGFTQIRSSVAGAGDRPAVSPVPGSRLIWDKLIDELLRIRGLPDDWDGDGSPAPPPALVDRAIQVACEHRAANVSPADRVHAGVNGTVYFEWFTPTGYAEIEVASPSEATYRWVPKGQAAVSWVRNWA